MISCCNVNTVRNETGKAVRDDPQVLQDRCFLTSSLTFSLRCLLPFAPNQLLTTRFCKVLFKCNETTAVQLQLRNHMRVPNLLLIPVANHLLDLCVCVYVCTRVWCPAATTCLSSRSADSTRTRPRDRKASRTLALFRVGAHSKTIIVPRQL